MLTLSSNRSLKGPPICHLSLSPKSSYVKDPLKWIYFLQIFMSVGFYLFLIFKKDPTIDELNLSDNQNYNDKLLKLTSNHWH